MILDLIVPGLGSAVDVLAEIYRLCKEMKEGQEACSRLHGRLEDLLREIHKMQTKGQMPPSDALNKYFGILANYYKHLLKYRSKPLIVRVVKQNKMMEELQEIHQDVYILFGMLQLAMTASMMDWKHQWESDRRKREEVLADIVRNDAAVRRELQSVPSQTEALMTLTYEIQRLANTNSEGRELIKQLKETLARVSSVTIGQLRPWFQPPEEVTYELKEFARGSFGTVHRGVWLSGTSVVVKCLTIDGSYTDERTQQHIEEGMNTWHGLNHPHVIKMLCACHVSSPPFIVCEDATNGNLCSFLARPGNMCKVWRLLHGAALGLDYLHKHRIVHGGLKLNNILVGADGLAKLCDFGLRAMGICSTLPNERSATPRIPGALRWRAPECLYRQPTFHSDVYSFAMCIIEAFAKYFPFSHLRDDDSVRDMLQRGEIPDRPDGLDDAAWELVIAMTTMDPEQRMPLKQVIAKLKAFADAETEKESKRARQVEEVAEPEAEVSAIPDLPLTTCETCNAGVPLDSAFCSPCTARLKTVSRDSPHAGVDLIDRASSVESLMAVIAHGCPELKEQALMLLAKKCIYKHKRKSLYSAENIQVLSDVMGPNASYFSQLYALELLNWAASDDDADLSHSKFEGLQKEVPEPSQGELNKAARRMDQGTTEQQEDALVLYNCLQKRLTGERHSQYDDSAITYLVKSLQSGTQIQKLWATYALDNFVWDNDANLVSVADKGGIPPLVGLIDEGDNEQKRWAALALGNLAKNKDNRDLITRANGVAPLVALVKTGDHDQKWYAAYTLSNLALTKANRDVIARCGGISPLVTLVRNGTSKQKKDAVDALCQLARNNDENRVSIAYEGGIPILARLATTGTDKQVQWAVRALGSLACGHSAVIRAMCHAKVIPTLQGLRNHSSADVRRVAKKALAKVREFCRSSEAQDWSM